MSVVQFDSSLTSDPGFVAAPPSEALGLHRFTAEQYYRMAKEGILTPDDRVELLEGIIVDMNPVYAPHVYAVEATRDAIDGLLPKGWIVREEKPLSLGSSDPHPDLAVVRGTRRDYSRRHPSASEVGLLVEIADTTLRRDREMKAPIYAAAGVPEYWIVNLVERQVEVYRDLQLPGDAAPAIYAAPTIIGADGRVPFRLSGQLVGEIPVADVLPPFAENQTP